MYSEMKHIVFKNDYVIAVCKDKEVADLYVKFLEEKEEKKEVFFGITATVSM